MYSSSLKIKTVFKFKKRIRGFKIVNNNLKIYYDLTCLHMLI